MIDPTSNRPDVNGKRHTTLSVKREDTTKISNKEVNLKKGELVSDTGQSNVKPTEVEKVVSKLTDYIQEIERDLQLFVDDSSGKVVVQVIDSGSQTILRQIPTDELLDLADHLLDKNDGVLIDKNS